MANESQQTTGLASSLLNAYSAKEISDIFAGIDKKIISLHQCSSDDFLTLNEHFKGYYRDSKKISANARQIFDLISGKENIDLNDQLVKYQTTFKNLTEAFETFIGNTARQADAIAGKLNLLFVPLNNYKQNIMALKYLATNIKLNAAYEEKEHGVMLANDSESMMLGIEDIKVHLNELDHALILVKKGSNDTFKRLEEIKSTNLEHIELINNRIRTSVNLLSKKNQEAIKKIPLLTQKTESSSGSLAKVITNLQFHDIIRQKIEHIQSTHKDIIKELEAIDANNTNVHNQAKMFLKIRDIAGLQAAQLLHANKEYQNAIESITARFVEIGDDLMMISTLCFELSVFSDGTDRTHFLEVRKNLEDATKFMQEFSKANDILPKQLARLKDSIKSVSNKISAILGYNDTLKIASEKVITDSAATEEVKTYGQVKTLQTDISQAINQCSELISEIENYAAHLHDFPGSDSETARIFNDMTDFSSQLPGFLASLTNSNETIQGLLNENATLSSAINGDIKTSIEGVKYYDFFEKSIDEIIVQLSTVNKRLTAEDTGTISHEEALKYIREKYTMASEHFIHDKILKKEEEGDTDLFDMQNLPESDAKKENDDNLELF
jgi:hypothetical protein